ncbi:cytochrome P450 [Rhypophila decipiens]|uniref:Cytochrome P450 n=1 Tax=Rhypophila decipiens TaxID=261697 RepID=A0AAN7B135_9PEZI|nr:cytochrome P450 [Rhypophila decipiens]
MLSNSSTFATLAVGALSAGIIYFFRRLKEQRRWYSDQNIPKPPHDWFWGNAKILGTYTSKITGNYMQAAWAQIKYDFKLPEVFYLDLWPFGPEFIVCSGPDALALPTTTNSYAQADVVGNYFAGVSIGATFIEASNGPVWKELHQMLAPGLTPSATKTYHDFILDEAKELHNRVLGVASSGSVTNMSFVIGQYPFSVIWRVFFGETFAEPDLYRVTHRLADICPAIPSLNPVTRYLHGRERLAITQRLDVAIEQIARRRFELLKAMKTLPTRTTATCLLDRMLLGHVQEGLSLDDRLMKLVSENGKGMLAAGFGTTTDTSSYIIMLLSVFPDALQKLREEHNHVFPADFASTLALLRSDPSVTKNLPYTTAVIQETLRLFPIGLVVRAPPKDMTSFSLNGKTYPVKPKQHTFCILGYAAHYDPSIFPEPSSFQPERFLKDDDVSFPRNAYRPFERGLRSCLGQNLAMDEMRIALVSLARWFDFELVGHNPVAVPRLAHTDLDTKLGDHAFQRSRFSAGPNGETRMKVRVAGMAVN